MKILIKPSDIVKRCLWDTYVYYIVGSDKEAQILLKEDIEFELSERDALIIGFLKIIETDNLIHKFNTYITEVLANKSVKNSENGLLIRKRILDESIIKYMDNFPEYWECSIYWKKIIKELSEYIDNIKKSIEQLQVFVITDKNIVSELYSTNSIKKLLKFNY
jgi:ribosome-interacting GTPase 1